MVVVVGGPQQQAPDAIREHRLIVQHLHHAFQLIEGQLAFLAHGDHNAHPLLFAKGHRHATARFGLHAVRQQVIKGTGKRNGQGNVSNGHRIFLT
ncbi:hypothetical protein D3C76_1639060 [compost metagenome]